MKIMFVCTGNTCRSPMAEAAAKAIFPKEGYEIISRGISVFESTPASENAQKAVAEGGLDLSQHMSKQISEEDIKTSDVIFTMTNPHKQMLSAVCSLFLLWLSLREMPRIYQTLTAEVWKYMKNVSVRLQNMLKKLPK